MTEQQLQELLSVYRYERPMPALPRRSTNATWWLAAAAAAAAVVLIVGGSIWANSWREGWRVLRAGDTIARPGRIQSRKVGYVDVAANTLIRYEGGDRLSLE